MGSNCSVGPAAAVAAAAASNWDSCDLDFDRVPVLFPCSIFEVAVVMVVVVPPVGVEVVLRNNV